MDLILIRHGLPITVDRQDGTPADPQLSAEGHGQASQMADQLAGEQLDALYVSPLKRALQTAAPLEQRTGLSATVEPGVVEFDRTSSVYVPLEELKANDYPRWRAMMDAGWYSDMDPKRFQDDVVQALEGLIAAHCGERVAVVCHGGVINVWAAHLMKLDIPLFFNPYYTSINRFICSRAGHRSVASLNETAHLQPGPHHR